MKTVADTGTGLAERIVLLHWRYTIQPPQKGKKTNHL